MNSVVWLFLMKKWLKSEVCGPINSVWYTVYGRIVKSYGLKKRKNKKEKKCEVKRKRANKSDPNTHYTCYPSNPTTKESGQQRRLIFYDAIYLTNQHKSKMKF